MTASRVYPWANAVTSASPVLRPRITRVLAHFEPAGIVSSNGGTVAPSEVVTLTVRPFRPAGQLVDAPNSTELPTSKVLPSMTSESDGYLLTSSVFSEYRPGPAPAGQMRRVYLRVRSSRTLRMPCGGSPARTIPASEIIETRDPGGAVQERVASRQEEVTQSG